MPDKGRWTSIEVFGRERFLADPTCLEVKLHAAEALQDICANNSSMALNADETYNQLKGYLLSHVDAAKND